MTHQSATNTLAAILGSIDTDNPRTKAVITPDGQTVAFGQLAAQVRGIQALFPFSRPRRVGILLERAAMLAPALAVLRAGGMFMLLNPEVAGCYIEATIRRNNLDFVITRPGLARKCPGVLQLHLPSCIPVPDETPAIAEVDDDTAAIVHGMRTISRRQIIRLASELAAHTGKPAENIVLPAFGLSDCDFILDSLATTLAGCTLAIMPVSKQDIVAKTMAYAEAERVTVITARPFLRSEIQRRKMTVPGTLRSILDRGCACV